MFNLEVNNPRIINYVIKLLVYGEGKGIMAVTGFRPLSSADRICCDVCINDKN